MLPIQKKSRAKFFNVKPFPVDISAVGYFTGLDVEIFEKVFIKALYESGCYGMNPKPRQVLNKNIEPTEAAVRRDEEWRKIFNEPETSNNFKLTQSSVFFLEEAFFLHFVIGSLEIKDTDENSISTEDLWMKFCRLKENFVECFIAFLYLKSKNWVIKPGMKFGGDFRKFLSIFIFSSQLNFIIFSTLQAKSAALSRFVHRHRF